jgi:hypothetical protein
LETRGELVLFGGGEGFVLSNLLDSRRREFVEEQESEKFNGWGVCDCFFGVYLTLLVDVSKLTETMVASLSDRLPERF